MVPINQSTALELCAVRASTLTNSEFFCVQGVERGKNAVSKAKKATDNIRYAPSTLAGEPKLYFSQLRNTGSLWLRAHCVLPAPSAAEKAPLFS